MRKGKLKWCTSLRPYKLLSVKAKIWIQVCSAAKLALFVPRPYCILFLIKNCHFFYKRIFKNSQYFKNFQFSMMTGWIFFMIQCNQTESVFSIKLIPFIELLILWPFICNPGCFVSAVPTCSGLLSGLSIPFPASKLSLQGLHLLLAQSSSQYLTGGTWLVNTGSSVNARNILLPCHKKNVPERNL